MPGLKTHTVRAVRRMDHPGWGSGGGQGRTGTGVGRLQGVLGTPRSSAKNL